MKDILLLHGAIGAAKQLQSLAELLQPPYNVGLLNLPGHGGELLPANGFSMELFADAVLRYLDDRAITAVNIFGYSMGGYLALYFARRYPERVEKIITLATKFHWDPDVAAQEINMLQPTVIAAKLPGFAEELSQRHAPHDWQTILLHTQQLLTDLGNSAPPDYGGIRVPCLLMLGDRDKMVSVSETWNAFRALPNAALAVLPHTGHPIEKTDATLLKFYIERFLGE